MKPRVQHICIRIPKEKKEGSDVLFIHGGDYESHPLCHYLYFNCSTFQWTKFLNNCEAPQLKAHAATLFKEPNKGENYVIITGGITREHLSNCYAENNQQKENCGCSPETISEQIYAYRDHYFLKIHFEKNEETGDRMKRFGHSMITVNNSIYILCGFIQYVGYVIDIIKLNALIDIKTSSFYFEPESIEVSKSMQGRMFASVNIVYDYIVIFGGTRDGKTLNDLWLINTKNFESCQIETDLQYLYPRFGSSSCILYNKESNKQTARLLIYGGSYWMHNNLMGGICNELCVFKMKFSQNDLLQIDVEKFIPLIYGKGSKRVFSNSFILNEKMYIFGGLSASLINFSFPDTRILKYDRTLNEYLKECKYFKNNNNLHLYLNISELINIS